MQWAGVQRRFCPRASPIPSGWVATLVRQQYYWIQHYHPISLMGYMMVIEGYPPTSSQLQDWQGKTGFPESAFTTLRKHALLDPFHRRDIDQLLDSLERNVAMLSMISRSAIQT